jgi:hypothetical protein
MLATEGIDTPEFEFKSSGEYKMAVAIFSHGMDNLQTYAGISSTLFKIETGSNINTETTVIPGWIKNNAGWWADGKIGDNDFVQGIQFLIKEGIMKIKS